MTPGNLPNLTSHLSLALLYFVPQEVCDWSHEYHQHRADSEVLASLHIADTVRRHIKRLLAWADKYGPSHIKLPRRNQLSSLNMRAAGVIDGLAPMLLGCVGSIWEWHWAATVGSHIRHLVRETSQRDTWSGVSLVQVRFINLSYNATHIIDGNKLFALTGKRQYTSVALSHLSPAVQIHLSFTD